MGTYDNTARAEVSGSVSNKIAHCNQLFKSSAMIKDFYFLLTAAMYATVKRSCTIAYIRSKLKLFAYESNNQVKYLYKHIHISCTDIKNTIFDKVSERINDHEKLL